jgi:glycosyltransferase involved in cell wall biosynthesis
MEARERTVIIVAPPWLRSGSGRLMEAQIHYYRARGFRTAFIGVANHRGHIAADPVWGRFREGAADLGSDAVAIAALERRPTPRALLRRLRQLFAHHTALDWIIEVGARARLPEDLAGFGNGAPPALIHANLVYTLGFAERLARHLWSEPVPIIVDTHDVQADICGDNSLENPWTRQIDTPERLLRRELRWLARAAALVHVSEDDLTFFSAHLPQVPQVLAVPPIMPDPAAQPAVSAALSVEPCDLLFVGAGHIANRLALEWFFAEVWPLLAPSGLTLTIVGDVEELVRLQRPELYRVHRAHFVGPVASINAYYRAARCVIAPMVSGRGTSMKTIEAMAFARPLVGTSKAFRGMPVQQLRADGLTPFDEPQAFAAAVRSALGAEHEGARNRAIYDGIFSQARYFAAIDEANRFALGRRSRSYSKS